MTPLSEAKMQVSMMQQALELAGLGFHVFPISQGSKIPAITEFPRLATRDKVIIENWWIKNPSYNIGISTSAFGDNEFLVAVDIDNKGDKDGDAEVARLAREGFTFPETFEQLTPTGGKHLVYRAAESFKQGVDVLGGGLDVRARGGYILGAGSLIGGRAYTFVNRGVEPVPSWVVSHLNRGRERIQNAGESLPGIDSARAGNRARDYARSASVAVEGAGGDHLTFAVAAKLKDFGVTLEECFNILSEEWNTRCAPPWDADALYSKVENAYKYGNDPVGINAPETDFQPVLPEEKKKHPFDEMSDKYAYVAGNKGIIIHETKDEDGNFELEFIDVPTFHQNESANRMLVEGREVAITKLWMCSPRRKTYSKIVFCPGKEADKRFYNLWRGFSVAPSATPSKEAKASVDAFLEHALLNVCDNNMPLFGWLISYFAHLVQKPGELPLVALAFRGAKGVGKNALVDRVGHLLGNSFGVISKRYHMLGNFNSILENKLLLVLDEAFWSGDKAAEGALKSLITGNHHLIERKNQEPYKVKNCLRVAILGNEDWLVPASEDERRYAVFNVGDGRKQDRKFFKDMREGMERGGYSYLLRYLLDFKIEADVTLAPMTAGLAEQKHRSLDPFNSWWKDCLDEGAILKSEYSDKWPSNIRTDSFRNAVNDYFESRKQFVWRPTAHDIGRKLRKLCPSAAAAQRREDGRPVRIYKLPPLEVARKEWDKFIGQDNKWESYEEEEEDGIFS